MVRLLLQVAELIGPVCMAGMGCAETLLCQENRLPRPAVSILEFRKTVLVDQVDLTPDNVLVQASVRVLGQSEAGPGRAPRATVVSARLGGTAP